MLRGIFAGLVAVGLVFACGTEDGSGGGNDECRDAKCQSMGGGGGMGGQPAQSNTCEADDECDDGEFCNGTEKCDPEATAANSKGCVTARSMPCEGQACDESSDECVSCEEGDVDKDGHKAIACDGDDCDDNDEDRYPGNIEVCDSAGHDEDCDPDTLGGPSDADVDKDTFVNAACCNELANGELACGDDCDDEMSGINPGQEEACNAIDDNCDGIVDGETDQDDLKTTYYVDADGDDFGAESTATRACMPPDTGWILNAGDCQDDLSEEPLATNVYPGALELCNGIDDDCDGDVDKADDTLEASPSNPGTDYDCTGGAWEITACPANKLHCDDNVLNGCETDGTALGTCHDCNTSCKFACGGGGCEEIVLFGGGRYQTCAVSDADRLYCWGRGTSGQIGDGAKASRNVPTFIGTLAASRIVGGELHTCALVSGQVYCWGNNANGQLGLGAVTEALTPTAINGITAATEIDAGQYHTCAVVAGVVKCWGQQQDGRLGNGFSAAAVKNAPTSALLAGGQGFTDAVAVATGSVHTCVLRSGGTVTCFGKDDEGQLGLPSSSTAQVLGQAVSLSGVTAIAAGAYHTCALAAGKVYCWGANTSHQISTAADASYDSPTEVAGLSGVVQITAGDFATCAVLGSGAMKCWGLNTFGELGAAPPPAEQPALPVSVPLSNVALATTKGSERTCVVVGGSSPGAYCFGWDDSGMLGNGEAGSTHVPYQLTLAP